MSTNWPTSADAFGTAVDFNTTVLAADPNNLRAAVDAIEKWSLGPPWFNVKAYGALGNGTADDTSAIQAAITAAQNNGGGIVVFPEPSGHYVISALLSITAGGITLLGSGMGNASTGGCVIKWAGATGVDMVSILGTAVARLDRVVVQGLILDGNATARYGLRVEKEDVGTFRDVRFRNCATANTYLVDSTGNKFYNAGWTSCNQYGLVADWGTGGLGVFGYQFSQAVANSQPMLLIQGAGNGYFFANGELDANAATFAGFVLLGAFDTNSLMPSAPTGGAGAPANVVFHQLYCNYVAPCTAATQGADILVSGTAANPVISAHFDHAEIAGGGIGDIAIRSDQATQTSLAWVSSSGHTAGTASMLDATANTAYVHALFCTSTDTNRISGAASSNVLDIQQGTAGLMTVSKALSTGGHLLTTGPTPTAVAGAQAGTSPPAPVVTTGSTDNGMRITFGTGTTPAAGAMVAVTFGTAFSVAPVGITLTPENAATQVLGLFIAAGSVTTTGFTASVGSAPAASQANTVYAFHANVPGHGTA